MAQIHYVVMYDTETKKWVIDDDTTTSKFDAENVWMENDQMWVSSEDDLWEEELEAINLLRDLLSNQQNGNI